MKTYSTTRCRLIASLLPLMLIGAGCQRSSTPAPSATPSSNVQVSVNGAGPITITSSKAEFQILPSGYVTAALVQGGQKLTLDTSENAPASNSVNIDGKAASFTIDPASAKVTDATGKIGRGRRVEIPAKSTDASSLQATFAVEVYDDFPNIAFATMEYKNAGASDIHVNQVTMQAHQLTSHSSGAPYDMWTFDGASRDWGEDEILQLKPGFSRPNEMGAIVKGGYGGGVPVVAFWTASVGEAIGHVETIPVTVALPVRVEKKSAVNTSLVVPGDVTLKAGESWSTPRSFVSVFAGDFYQPLRLWSNVLAKEGWQLPKPSNEAYNASWCGWGYEFNVTPDEMVGTIPKLKEMGIKWATLDDRWFNTYGDWDARSDTFPGDSIKKMVADFHKQGELIQLWWLPLGVEDGQGRWESHKYIVSKVVKEHPDWLILDKEGKHGRITRDLAALCPAVPEVQAYYKQLTEKFIRDWDFDGSKLDNIYTVPMCYNPAHHHKSPQDSVNAMADVYKTIYQTTRSIKPESVTQSCPCGTPPSLAWLPYMDQAVTADPVGAIQVRRRIKMYKALLGPESAVYGDHVELSEMSRVGKNWNEHGQDFASTVGTGGVVGTKFVWPENSPKFKTVALTPAKEAHWKKWLEIYNQKMLSKGTFLDLYTYGYDAPEAYAISKDGKMYYAFFAPNEGSWKGELQLRGLDPGSYHVVDYVDGKDLGTVQASSDKVAKIQTDFKDHLLIEVSK